MSDIGFILDEALYSLMIMKDRAAGQDIDKECLEKVFKSRGYTLLKERETSMGRDLDDEEFMEFLLSHEVCSRFRDYDRIFEMIRDMDLYNLSDKALSYLPETAVINTRIIPLIKKKPNSFVYKVEDVMCIFIYINPDVTKEMMENTLVHELHHIGMDSLEREEKYKGLTWQPRKSLEWLSALGEGFAVLAAAGGVDVHPAAHDAKVKEIWDVSMLNYNSDLKDLDQFFQGILEDSFESPEEVDKKGFEFFGFQGPWYTVGWKMAAVIEKIYGKKVLIECMADLTKLLDTYNSAAVKYNEVYGEDLSLWTELKIR